jgi:hypothetical protein
MPVYFTRAEVRAVEKYLELCRRLDLESGARARTATAPNWTIQRFNALTDLTTVLPVFLVS